MVKRVGLLATTALGFGLLIGASPALAQSVTIKDGNGGKGFLVTDQLSSASNPTVVGKTYSVGDANTQTVFTNYNTEGGAGSGGGAGLGGVFFIDTGASLTLNNVSFSSNLTKGGEGGGVAVASVGAKAFSLASATADGSSIQLYLPEMQASYSNGTITVSGLTLKQSNPLLGVGSGVAITGSGLATTISDISTDADGNQSIAFEKPYVLPTSSVITAGFRGASGNDAAGYYVNGSYEASKILPGALVYGDGIPAGTTIQKVNYNDDQTIKSFTLSNGVTTATNVAVVAVSSFDVTRFQSSLTGSTLSNTITPTGAIAGFEVGMTITGDGVPTGTTVTAVDKTTGVITLSNAVDLSKVTSIKGASNPVVSNVGQAVVTVRSTSGLAVGQIISGQGIPDGTKIVAIDGDRITLSSAIGAAGLSAIQQGKMMVTLSPVTSIDTANRSITLVSLDGLKVGQLLTGDPSIPENAVITSIDAATKTVRYVIDPSVANLNKGGSMNGIVSSGTVGANGGSGRAASDFNAILVDGEGSVGTNGYNAQNGSGAAGGNGGNGGSGSDGLAFNLSLTKETVDQGVAMGQAIAEVAGALATFPPGAALAAALGAKVAYAAVNLGLAVANLTTWNIDLTQGKVAFGGAGGTGGAGGKGSDFFGGGSGGSGGSGGDGALSVTDGGAGGDGGSGGAGGFGAGGGSGGSGGAGGDGGQSLDGADGSGGAAGFGGGVGSSAASGGGGGSGYGGAIFVRNGGQLFVTGDARFENNSALAGSSNNGGVAGDAAGSDLFMMKGSLVYLSPGVGKTITFNGTIADDSAASIVNASIAAGAGADIHISDGGLVQFLGQNTYSGTTYLHGGTLRADDGIGINAKSHIMFAGGSTIGTGQGPTVTDAGTLLTSGAFERRVGFASNQLSWTDSTGTAGGSGGFAATADGLTLNFGALNGGRGQVLTWNTGGFVRTADTLVFGSDAAEAVGAVRLLNDINLNGLTGKVAVYDNLGSDKDYAEFAGNVTNGKLAVNSANYAGTLYLTGQNALSGITVANGFVTTKLDDRTGRLMDATNGGSVNVTGGTLLLAGAEKLTTVQVSSNAMLAAAGKIQAGDIGNAGVIVFGDETSTGNITNSGTLTLTSATTAGRIHNQVDSDLGQIGTVLMGADLSATSVVNDGAWGLSANLTANETVTNNGVIVVDGARTIQAAGLAGNADGVVQVAKADSALRLDQSGNSIYAGTITGEGSFTKAGAGVLTMTGANSFTGGLSIEAGTIDTTAGGSFADALNIAVAEGAAYVVGTNDVVGAVNNAGALTANANLGVASLTNSGQTQINAVFISSGNVANTGTLGLGSNSSAYFGSLTNEGTVTADAALTIGGQYQQNAGTLVANADVFTGSLSGAGGSVVLNGASKLVVDQTEDGVYSGAVSGTGIVTKLGAATLTLNGIAGSFAPSALDIQFGQVTAATAGVLDTMLNVGIGEQGTLTLLADQTINDLSGTGLLNIGTNSLTLAKGGSFTGKVNGTGDLKLTSGSFDLNDGGGFSTGTIMVEPDSVLTVGTSSTLGADTLIVKQARLNVEGNVTATTLNVVDGSTLHLGNGVSMDQPNAMVGTVAATTLAINGGGRLTGNGQITGNTIVGGATGGIIAPGNSPGVMTFDNLAYGDNAVAEMEIDGPNGPGVAGGHDLVIVNDTLALSGSSTLEITKSTPNDYEIALGSGIQIFKVAPGHVTGQFGSVTKDGYDQNLVFNLSNGTVLGFGNYTPDSFVSAVAGNATQAAALNTMLVGSEGGVAQYYGGNLLPSLTKALSEGPAVVRDVFERWSPDAYAGIIDQMKFSMLQNLPDAGGYAKLTPGKLFATGAITNGELDGRNVAGYARNHFRDTTFNVGFAGDLNFARLNVSYGRATGKFHGKNIDADVNGNQFGLAASVPVAMDQALRLTGRIVYGDYDAKGSRNVLGGTARFSSVDGDTFAYGAGIEYSTSGKRVSFQGRAELIGLSQTLHAFKEQGGEGLDLFEVQRTKSNTEIGKIDAQLGYALSSGTMAYAKLGYVHEFGDSYTDIGVKSAYDPVSLTVVNAGLGQDRVQAGLGIQTEVNSRLRLNAEALGGTYGSYRIGAGLQFAF